MRKYIIIFVLLLFSLQEGMCQWTRTKLPSQTSINSFQWVNKDTAYLICYNWAKQTNYLYMTNDQCQSWKLIYDSFPFNVTKMHWFDSQHGNFGNIETRDGGKTLYYLFNLKDEHNVAGLYFWTKHRGMMDIRNQKGANTIFITEDAGRTWTELNYKLEFYNNSYSSINFASTDSMTGYCIGYDEKYNYVPYKSIDGGKTWSAANLESNRGEKKFYNTDYGFSVYKGSVYKTLDGGKSWQSSGNGIDTTNNSYVNSIYFNDSLTGFAVSSNGIYKTTNGGKDWSKTLSPPTNIGSTGLTFDFANNDLNYGAFYWTNPYGALYITTNGGGVTSINQKQLTSIPVNIYPNPAMNRVTVDLKAFEGQGEIQFVLRDITGKSIRQMHIAPHTFSDFSIDVSALKPGTYLLEFNSPQGRSIAKWIKE